MILTREELTAILLEASGEAPREVCGFLIRNQDGTKFKHLPARNVHDNPERHFTIDPHTMLRAFKEESANGWGIHVVYHSHALKDSSSRMSPDDLKGAKAFLRASHYLIVALPSPDFWEASAYRWDLDRKAWTLSGCAIGTFRAQWMDQPDAHPLVVVET